MNPGEFTWKSSCNKQQVLIKVCWNKIETSTSGSNNNSIKEYKSNGFLFNNSMNNMKKIENYFF